MQEDKDLFRRVYSEDLGPFTVCAYITRFGDLLAVVWAPDTDTYSAEDGAMLWEGGNILDARAWVKQEIARCTPPSS